MVERSWEDLEQPILEAVAELEDTDVDVGLPALADHTGLPLDRVRIGVRRLFDTDLLTGLDASADEFYPISLRLLPRGRQMVRQWPSNDPAEALLQALAQRIAVEQDPEVRGRLEKARDSLGRVGQGVLAGIITAVVQQVSGLG